MVEDPDRERLKQLEERLSEVRGRGVKPVRQTSGLNQGEAAWRMVIELVAGMGLGLAIGYGLDTLFGTKPVLIVIFSLLGFAAGIKTMLGTAKHMRLGQGTDDPGQGPDDGKKG